MPITRKQFEIGVDTKIEEWMKKIHAFLAEHKSEAFTESELRNQWSPDYDQRNWITTERGAMDQALLKLVELGAVAGKSIRENDYYSYYKPLVI